MCTTTSFGAFFECILLAFSTATATQVFGPWFILSGKHNMYTHIIVTLTTPPRPPKIKKKTDSAASCLPVAFVDRCRKQKLEYKLHLESFASFTQVVPS